MKLVTSLPEGLGSTFEDTVRSARPMLFEGTDETYPYWGYGSGFFAALGPRWFLFTAAHVVRGVGVEEIRVFPNEFADTSVPFDREVTGDSMDVDDTDKADVRCYRVAAGDLIVPDGTRMLGIDLGAPLHIVNRRQARCIWIPRTEPAHRLREPPNRFQRRNDWC